MRRPAVQIAQKTIPLLGKFGLCISLFFIMVWSLCLMTLPLAASLKNGFVVAILSLCPLPLTLIWPIAVLGTACDELLSMLNDARADRLTIDDEHRVESLRRYLKDLNREQGLGFVLFGVVLDKRKIAQVAGKPTTPSVLGNAYLPRQARLNARGVFVFRACDRCTSLSFYLACSGIAPSWRPRGERQPKVKRLSTTGTSCGAPGCLDRSVREDASPHLSYQRVDFLIHVEGRLAQHRTQVRAHEVLYTEYFGALLSACTRA